MKKFTDKQIKVIELASKKGNNADLLLMIEIQKVDEKIDKIETDLIQKIKNTAEEIKQELMKKQ